MNTLKITLFDSKVTGYTQEVNYIDLDTVREDYLAPLVTARVKAGLLLPSWERNFLGQVMDQGEEVIITTLISLIPNGV